LIVLKDEEIAGLNEDIIEHKVSVQTHHKLVIFGNCTRKAWSQNTRHAEGTRW